MLRLLLKVDKGLYSVYTVLLGAPFGLRVCLMWLKGFEQFDQFHLNVLSSIVINACIDQCYANSSKTSQYYISFFTLIALV